MRKRRYPMGGACFAAAFAAFALCLAEAMIRWA